jgi:hypothetical protein
MSESKGCSEGAGDVKLGANMAGRSDSRRGFGQVLKYRLLFVAQNLLQMDDLLGLEEQDVMLLFPDVIGGRNRLLRSLEKLRGNTSKSQPTGGAGGAERGGQPSACCTLS